MKSHEYKVQDKFQEIFPFSFFDIYSLQKKMSQQVFLLEFEMNCTKNSVCFFRPKVLVKDKQHPHITFSYSHLKQT